MIVKKFLIAGGNSTSLVYDCFIVDRNKISKKLLKEVEQVGFVSTKATLPKLTMMGGELCINATLAFASTLNKNGKLTTIGLKNPIPYFNKNGSTSIQIPFKFKQNKNIILLNGIDLFFITQKKNLKLKNQNFQIYQKNIICLLLAELFTKKTR